MRKDRGAQRPGGWHAATVPNGCYIHPDCFTCPREDCVLSTGNLHRHQEKRERMQRLEELHKSGASVEEMARRENLSAISMRQILRAVATPTGDA